MIVTCEKCDTRFTLDEAVLEEGGSKVQCSNCDHVFTVFPPTHQTSDEDEIDLLLQDLTAEEEKPAEAPERKTAPPPENGLEFSAPEPEEETPFDEGHLDLSEISELPGSDADGLEGEDISEGAGKPPPPGAEQISETDELEFVLGDDLEMEGETAAQTPPGEESKVEFDLSDLEDILRPEKEPATEKKSEDALEGVLKEEPPKEPPIEFDIEILDDTAPAPSEEPEPVEETVAAGTETGSTDDVDVIDELDLTEFKEDVPAEPAVPEEKPGEAHAPADASPMESDTPLELEERETIAPPAEAEADTDPDVPDRFAKEPRIFEKDMESFLGTERPPETFSVSGKPKGARTPLVVLLILVLLGGAGYGAYVFAPRMGIPLPDLMHLFKTEVRDPGNLKMRIQDVDGHFIAVSSQDKRFVISGKVKNNYPRIRRDIRVTANLLNTKQEILASKTVYCGNLIPETDLVQMDMETIDARLSAPPAEDAAQTRIPPGQTGPFMIVFGNLQPTMEEYSVVVEGSQEIK